MTDHPFIDLLPAYALDCLDPDERQSVAQHLADCSTCQEQLRSFQALTAKLALAVPQVQLPARLKTAILRRVIPRVDETEKQTSWFNRLFQPARPVWAAISLALIFILALGNLALFQQLQQRPPAMDEFRLVKMTAPNASSQATALLVMDHDGNAGTLVVDGLAPLTAQQQYQLWLIKDNKRTSGGIFAVSADGYGYLAISATTSLLTFDSFGVTIEPAGGSPGPTGPKVLGGSF